MEFNIEKLQVLVYLVEFLRPHILYRQVRNPKIFEAPFGE